MSLPSVMYRQCVSSGADSLPRKIAVRCFRLLRKTVLRITDPACVMSIRGRFLKMPLSHQLPLYTQADSQYDALLRRVTDHIRDRHGAVCGIDIGANIGDTVVACANDAKDSFLAVEPNPKFIPFLKANTSGIPNVTVREVVAGEEDKVAQYDIATRYGTAKFTESRAPGAALETKRLDTLLEEQPAFKSCNFLKVDTDGHDFEVLRGAAELIRRAKPVTLIECDPFDNPSYVEHALEAVRFFASCGYHDMLVYDNTGFLVCRLNLQDTRFFCHLLFYQLTRGDLYYDLLFMPDGGKFLQEELRHFERLPSAPIRSRAAREAATPLGG